MFYLLKVAWIEVAQIIIEIHKIQEVLTEHGSRGECHQDLQRDCQHNLNNFGGIFYPLRVPTLVVLCFATIVIIITDCFQIGTT